VTLSDPDRERRGGGSRDGVAGDGKRIARESGTSGRSRRTQHTLRWSLRPRRASEAS